jgi:hypothetical protein
MRNQRGTVVVVADEELDAIVRRLKAAPPDVVADPILGLPQASEATLSATDYDRLPIANESQRPCGAPGRWRLAASVMYGIPGVVSPYEVRCALAAGHLGAHATRPVPTRWALTNRRWTVLTWESQTGVGRPRSADPRETSPGRAARLAEPHKPLRATLLVTSVSALLVGLVVGLAAGSVPAGLVIGVSAGWMVMVVCLLRLSRIAARTPDSPVPGRR